MTRAAGLMLLYRADDGDRVLLLRRSGYSDHAGEWCFPGGGLRDGETALEAAERECLEEIGPAPYGSPRLWTRQIRDDVDYITFLAYTSDEFTPRLNNEHNAYVWAPVADLVGQASQRGRQARYGAAQCRQ